MIKDTWLKAGGILIAIFYLGIIWLVLKAAAVPGGKDGSN